VKQKTKKVLDSVNTDEVGNCPFKRRIHGGK